MLHKAQHLKLSTQKLEALTQQLLDQCPQSGAATIPLIVSPRFISKEFQELNIYKTQKLPIASKPNTFKQKLPSIKRMESFLKQNLLDLDQYFEFDNSQNCQNNMPSEKRQFVIRKMRTPSISSKGKVTTTGSSENSFDIFHKEDQFLRNETESIYSQKKTSRGKSQSKPFMPCRIINSKKLPFLINPNTHRRQKEKAELELDISVIYKDDSPQPLMTSQSFSKLFGSY